MAETLLKQPRTEKRKSRKRFSPLEKTDPWGGGLRRRIFQHCSMDRKSVTEMIARRLMETHFAGEKHLPEFRWMKSGTYRRASQLEGKVIYLHPELYAVEWYLLLEFEIYRQLLNWKARKNQKVKMDVFEEAAELGHFRQRLILLRRFLGSLYGLHARRLKLKKPKSKTLHLAQCETCGGKTHFFEGGKSPEKSCACGGAGLKIKHSLCVVQRFKGMASPWDGILDNDSGGEKPLFEDLLAQPYLGL